MNKKIMLIISVIVLLALLALIIFYLNKNSTSETISKEEITEIQKTNSEPSAKEPNRTETQIIPDWKKYKNATYGFTLAFPESWQGYTVTKRTLDWGDFGTSDSFDFGFPAQPDGLFNISIHTKEQWKNITGEGGPLPGYLDENETYIFAWSQAQYTANSEMEKRMKEIQDIIKTFELIKD